MAGGRARVCAGTTRARRRGGSGGSSSGSGSGSGSGAGGVSGCGAAARLAATHASAELSSRLGQQPQQLRFPCEERVKPPARGDAAALAAAAGARPRAGAGAGADGAAGRCTNHRPSGDHAGHCFGRARIGADSPNSLGRRCGSRHRQQHCHPLVSRSQAAPSWDRAVGRARVGSQTAAGASVAAVGSERVGGVSVGVVVKVMGHEHQLVSVAPVAAAAAAAATAGDGGDSEPFRARTQACLGGGAAGGGASRGAAWARACGGCWFECEPEKRGF
jgi:hypothetical protein